MCKTKGRDSRGQFWRLRERERSRSLLIANERASLGGGDRCLGLRVPVEGSEGVDHRSRILDPLRAVFGHLQSDDGRIDSTLKHATDPLDGGAGAGSRSGDLREGRRRDRKFLRCP